MAKEKHYLTENAKLMSEWNWEKNEKSPDQYTLGSGQKVWWKCKNGHEWEARIADRNSGTNCPVCSDRTVLFGYNDFESKYPELAKDWHPTKNGNLTPKMVSYGSSKKIWWICDKGHEWEAQVKTRTSGIGCPYCSGRCPIKGENDLQTVNPELANEWNYEKNGELTPLDVLPNSRKKVWWKCIKGHEWQARIDSRSNGNGCPICHSERNTSFPEYALLYYLSKCGLEPIHSYKERGYELDIYIPSKEIAIEYDGYFWHKNKTKEDLEKNKKCKEDGIILYRIREGLPLLNDYSVDYHIQKNQKDLPRTIELLLNKAFRETIDVDLTRDSFFIENLREYTEKENSILFSHPEVAEEWNYEKNGYLKPDYFVKNSHKRVWWKCHNGHEWQATIDSRSSGNGCPYCSGRSAITGVNDFETVNPVLAKEWNHEKNGNLTPKSFKPNSGKKVWWKCSKGHEWQAKIASRSRGNGCPVCKKENAKIRPCKKVRCVETGVIYNSLKEAASAVNRTSSAIHCCASGKTKTCGGYHWKYDKE